MTRFPPRNAALAFALVVLVAPRAVAGPTGAAWFRAPNSIVPPATSSTYALAISGSLAVVGAPGVSPYLTGQVFVYERVGRGSQTTWNLVQTITRPSDTSGEFGATVAIGGGFVFVGAPMTRPGTAGTFHIYPLGTGATDAGSADGDGGPPLLPACPTVAAAGGTVFASDSIALLGLDVYTATDDGGPCPTWQAQEEITEQAIPPCAGNETSLAVLGSSVVLGETSCNVFLQDDDGAWVALESRALPPGPMSAAGDTIAIASPVGDAGTTTYSFQTYDLPGLGTASLTQEQALVASAPLLSSVMSPGVVFFDSAVVDGGAPAAYSFVQSGTAWTAVPVLAPGAVGAVDGDTALVRGTSSVPVLIRALADGTACASGDACWSNFCEEGFCCATECAGGCATCATGTCQPLPYGTVASCAPYVCDGATLDCPTFCTSDAYCVAGSYCVDGVCLPLESNGGTCDASDQCSGGTCVEGTCHGSSPAGAACGGGAACATGYCVDGVCCDSPCDGQCQACDVDRSPGVCAPVRGEPHGSRAPCGGAGACAGTCDGTGATPGCTYPASACAKVCANGTETDLFCNEGECLPRTSRSCGSYVCDDAQTTCLSSCTAQVGCATGYACDAGSCAFNGPYCDGDKSRNVSVAANGGETDCAPYACSAATGDCESTCATEADCAGGYVCDPNEHRCTAPPATGGAVGVGCTCRLANRRSRGTPAFALGVAGVLAVLVWRRGRDQRRKVLRCSRRHGIRRSPIGLSTSHCARSPRPG